MRLHAPAMPRHLLSVSFSVAGGGANSESGELTEFWLAPQNWRWTAKLGDYSVSRLGVGDQVFEEGPAGIVPMRIHMLRNTIFWAAQELSAGAQFRFANAVWNGRPVTCLLVSDEAAAARIPWRRWDEAEYCIDQQTALLQILSPAPGVYTVYGYQKGASFNGQPIPDHLTTYVAGTAVIDATLRVEDIPEQAPLKPAGGLLGTASPAGLEQPAWERIDVPDSSVTEGAVPVVVNAQVGPQGDVMAQEVCASADPSLTDRALEYVRTMGFARSGAQRQTYVLVRFVPRESTPARTAGAHAGAAPLSPVAYYLELSVTLPQEPAVGTEIRARRSDGATVMIAHNPAAPAEDWRELRFPDGKSATIYDNIKAKVTWPEPIPLESLAPGQVIDIQELRNSPISLPSDCHSGSGEVLLRMDQMEGQEVEVLQLIARSHRITMWAAPKLGCQPLYVDSEVMLANGSFRPAAETKTTRLTLGEPDPGLFEIGTDLAEMKPSEARCKAWESMNPRATEEQKAAALREVARETADDDRRYERKP